MHAALSLISLIALTAPLETQFVQVAGVFRESPPFQRSAGQQRAVILIHGIQPHPFSRRQVSKAAWSSWQMPGSVLVSRLGKEADVFAFAYSQSERVEQIPKVADFAAQVRRLKQMGYREIVLVGHSAGGLVGRHVVEDDPVCGVTKVIQVCTPNGGTLLGKARFGVRKPQEAFLYSLSKKGRQRCLEERGERTIPRDVQFVCLVGQLKLPASITLSLRLGDEEPLVLAPGREYVRGDGVVSAASQWPVDLQKQGIPAIVLATTHFTVMKRKATAEQIAELVRTRQPRWDAARVAEMRRKWFGKDGSE